MIFTYKDIKKNIEESCDVCVVGSGAGGAVMAKELAESGLKVILIEEGSYYTTSDFNNTDTIDSISRLFRDGGSTVALGKPNVIWAEGRCVGGSTVINGGMSWRTPEKILKRWQWEQGLVDLTPKKMEPYFERVEKILGVSPVLPEAQNKDASLLKKGADRLGYRVKANLRSNRGCVGTNQCVTGCPTGGKQSTLVTYIPEFLKRGGVLYANCRVKKIRLKGGRATGVKGVIVNPDTKEVIAKIKIHSRATVVCGGAVQTPALLLRSGVPCSSKKIGKNLLLHPNAKVVGVFDERVEAWKGVNQAYQVTEFMDEGILMGVNFIPPGILSMAFPFYGAKAFSTMKEIFNHCVVGAALIEDTSPGRVQNLPLDQVLTTYSLNKVDFEKALRAVALYAEIYFAAGARKVYLPFSNLHEIHTIDEIRKIYESGIRPIDLELMTVHIMGTCQMGVKKHESVVNPFGEMHDVKGLFVADASVFPTSIGVNPQESIMALSTRTAFHIAEHFARYR